VRVRGEVQDAQLEIREYQPIRLLPGEPVTNVLHSLAGQKHDRVMGEDRRHRCRSSEAQVDVNVHIHHACERESLRRWNGGLKTLQRAT